jgi:hypothetical protein
MRALARIGLKHVFGLANEQTWIAIRWVVEADGLSDLHFGKRGDPFFHWRTTAKETQEDDPQLPASKRQGH